MYCTNTTLNTYGRTTRGWRRGKLNHPHPLYTKNAHRKSTQLPPDIACSDIDEPVGKIYVQVIQPGFITLYIFYVFVEHNLVTGNATTFWLYKYKHKDRFWHEKG